MCGLMLTADNSALSALSKAVFIYTTTLSTTIFYCYERNNSMSQQAIISIVIFVVVIVAIMSEKVHRSVAAVAGVVALIMTGILTIETSVEYIDFNTIGVLVGMMLFVAVVKQSGIFEYIAIKSAKLVKGEPWHLMIVFMVITAVLSAFLDNVTTVLLIGPMTIAITKILELNPVPFLMTQILASNIGGTGTLIGDPPNIMIGSAAGLSFADFIINTGGIAIVILIVTIFAFKFIYGRKLFVSPEKMKAVMELDENEMVKDRALMHKSVVMIILVAVGFMLHSQLHLESSIIALAAAVIMILIGKQNVEETIADVEWPTIVFFTALFMVVGGMESTGVIEKLADLLMGLTGGDLVVTMIIILWASAVLSAILDNIPFVATMIPMIITMEASGMDVIPLWWALSLGACLGGNGTLIGASANVVLSGISGRHGHPITFMQFTKLGFPMMILSIIVSTIYLMIRFGF